ncbi:MAG TPA: hypothetical protein DCS66_17865 [Flavobacteriaceae bacterium]|nr:hypothetical protein [Flavobacteriaceae bacterium]HAT66434.1 hypothetical protein [Flavobacteriaceae bacterium]|tara:strand:+ start:124 stop:639 length:516 start_codon:yes stop_codon:yes gene_type:complete
MFENLKKRALQKHTEKNIKNRDTSQINSKMKTLGFLVDEMIFQDLEKLHDFSKIFGLQPKDVKVFSFMEVKKKLPTLQQNQINNKDFNWKGEIQNQNAREFLERDFDVLVGSYNGKHRFLDLLVSESKAKFKVGFKDADPRLYDLLIAVSTNDLPTFIAELKKYITLLNKV